MAKMEATYLAWLDCSNLRIPGNPFEFFLKEAKVALNDGSDFGKGGEGFVRLNFACSRETLTDALDRMRSALKRL
jgi:cystathionine beta-lyase